MNWVQRLNAMLGPQAGVIKNLAAPIFIVTVLAMMVLPMPSLMLDFFLTVNIAVALLQNFLDAFLFTVKGFTQFLVARWRL